MESGKITAMVMSVAAPPSRPRYAWEWLALLHARWITLVLALLIGLLSLTAVQEMKVECRSQNQILTSESGVPLTSETGRTLVTDDEGQQCQLVVGRARVPLPRGDYPTGGAKDDDR